MNISLYQAASALNAMDRWQETIAENLASASVPGFKKQDFSFAALEAGLLPEAGANGTKGSHQLLMPSGHALLHRRLDGCSGDHRRRQRHRDARQPGPLQ